MTSATIQRDTKETRIQGTLKTEGRGRYDLSTGLLRADGDLHQHHVFQDERAYAIVDDINYLEGVFAA